MPVKVTIDGIGTVTFGDEFNDLSEDEQAKLVDEVYTKHKNQPQTIQPKNVENTIATNKDDDWIGQTAGGFGGGVGGAVLGAKLGAPLAPFTFGLSVPIGAILGGAIGAGLGGAGGEYVEKKIENDWNDLTPQEQEQIIESGIEEGIWGAIPGAAGGLGQGARLLIKSGNKTATSFVKDKIKALFKNKAFRAATSKTGSVGVGQVASDVAGKAFDVAIDSLPLNKIAQWGAKLSDKNKKVILEPLIKVFHKELTDHAAKVGGKVNPNLLNELYNYGYGSAEALEKLFKRVGSTPQGQAAIKKWAQSDIVKKALIAGGVVAGKGVGKALTDIDYSSGNDSSSTNIDSYDHFGNRTYNKGGYVTGGLLGKM